MRRLSETETAPSAVAPSVFPRLREKMIDEVAPPRIDHSTLSCTRTMPVMLIMPIPKPIRKDPTLVADCASRKAENTQL
jgi:hypothetical protein